MATNILFVVPNSVDATSWYRAYGPFGALRRTDDVNLIVTDRYTWATMQMVDMLFMQRPYKQQHYQLIEMAKECNVPVWVDYDDDLFSVPIDNPSYSTYADEKTQKTIAKIIAASDVVTVSTLFLKRRLEQLNKNIVVIENALNDFILDTKFKPKMFKDRKNLFNWRGSNTHQKDIMVHGEAFFNVQKKSEEKKWKWHWIAYNPWFINDQFPEGQVIVSPGMDVMEYHTFISHIQPKCQIVPLADNKFNHSKSNIAWIEATWSGAVTIAPDWEEWRQPGVLTYKNTKELEEKMNEVMELSDDELEIKKYRSREIINEKYLLSSQNHKRSQILKKHVKKRSGWIYGCDSNS